MPPLYFHQGFQRASPLAFTSLQESSDVNSPLTLVFDLDGTLVDTAPDLIAAANHVMAQTGRPPAVDAVLRPAVSHGALAMVRAAIGPEARDWPEEKLYPLFEAFIAYYERHIADVSRPFPGVLDALDRAAAAGHILAVCTNKREKLARQLLSELGMTGRFAAISGRDTFPVYKPDPVHLTATIARAGGADRRAVMIGDSSVDVATAKAAGIPVVAVGFGYSDPPVATFAPDHLIHHYDEFDGALASLVRQGRFSPVPD